MPPRDDQPPSFTSLIPGLGPVQAGPWIASLELHAPDERGRPYTLVNFVSSADGHATFAGRSRALGDRGDRELFQALRGRVDAVLAGTQTMKIERYGRLVPDPERRRRRVEAGRAPEPLAVLVSRRGRFPLDIPLFAEPEARVVGFTPVRPADLDGVRASVQVELLQGGPSDSPLAEAMATLYRDHAVRTLLCEGGPTLFGALLHAGLVDELFLTLAPALTGGDSGPSLTAGPPLDSLARLELRSLLQLGSSLYARYQVKT